MQANALPIRQLILLFTQHETLRTIRARLKMQKAQSAQKGQPDSLTSEWKMAPITSKGGLFLLPRRESGCAKEAGTASVQAAGRDCYELAVNDETHGIAAPSND